MESPSFLSENNGALEELHEQVAAAMELVQRYQEVVSDHDELLAILNTLPLGILLFDREGHLQRANSTAEKLVGHSLTAYIGESIIRWIRAVGRVEVQCVTGCSLSRLHHYMLDIARDPRHVTRRAFEQKNGSSERYIDETGIPILDRRGRTAGWLVIWRDITEEHHLNLLREELSSMIVHDLRSPLTAVLSSLNMLRDLLHENYMDTSMMHEIIQIAMNSGENMLSLVQSLLDLTRFEQHGMTLDCEFHSLAEIINRACGTVFSLALGAQIDMKVNVPESLPAVWVDEEKIHRVLLNLLDNALRHTPLGGTIDIEVGPDTDRRLVLVRITDTGSGVPVEARERIFEKFTQLEHTVQRGHKGTGLGLPFCRLAVEAHGGRIWVEDKDGGGAAFCFTLPVQGPGSRL